MPVRITDSSIATRVLGNLQRNLLNLSDIQQRVSTGLRFSRPSDNPSDYVASLGFRNDLNAIRRFTRNIDRGLSQLNVTDSNLSNVNDVLQRARELTVSGNNEALSREARSGIADEVAELLERVVESGNASLNGLYIFSGDRTGTKPFEFDVTADGRRFVRYLGDTGRRDYEIAQGVTVPVNIDGLEAFFASIHRITALPGVADVNDALVNQLPAAPPASNGDWTGTFTVNGATITVEAADTLATVRDKINLANADVQAAVDANGRLILTSLRSEPMDLADGTSNLLSGLGMFKRIEGGVLEPGGTLTAATTLASLGVTPETFRMTLDGTVHDVDFTGAANVGDLLAAINNSGAPVNAFINEAGTGITITATARVEEFAIADHRRVFGQSLGMPVSASTTIASLGLGPLSALNIAVGSDSRNIDLSGAATVGDVLDALNAGHPLIVASLNAAGDGIDIALKDIDKVGIADITITEVGAGTTAMDLGLFGVSTASGASALGLAGTGIAEETANTNIFQTLLHLEKALRADAETETFDQLLEEIDAEFSSLMTLRTRNGARVNRFEETSDRYSREELFITELLSTNEDVDLAEVVTELQLRETTLQAALASSARAISATILDYLR